MIKTVGELRKIIDDLEDDYEINMRIVEMYAEEELKKMLYPYPYKYIDANLEFHDVGVSDRVILFGAEKK